MSFLVQFESVVIDVERIVVATLHKDSVTLLLDGLADPVDFDGAEAQAIKQYLSIRKAKPPA